MKINVNDISYKYDSKNENAISNINLSFKDGDFTAIVGKTGSGKSTFVQTLNGLIIPQSGTINVDDRFIISNRLKIKNIKSLRKTIGIVFQFPEYQLFEDSVRKDIIFGPKNFGIDESKLDELAKYSLELVGLDESFLDKSPFELSGGEKRKVAIATILSFKPDVLILDEPTAGLDGKSSIVILELLKKLSKEGTTIIVITHQMDYVLEYFNRVIVFSNSKVVFDDTPVALFNNKEIVSSYDLSCPKIISLIEVLKEKYPSFKNYQIRNIDDFVNAYKEITK